MSLRFFTRGWSCYVRIFFFKQKTAYEMRISDWSSDVCSSDLHQAQLAGAGDAEVGRLILVAERVAADDDRVGPAGGEAVDGLHHDRVAEDAAAQDVADRAVRRLPHLFQAEFLDARFVGSDRRAFHADAIFLDRVRGIDGDLVVGAVALLDTKVVIMKVDVEIGKDQPLTDPLPDDPGHFVAVEFDDRVGYLDLAHAFSLFPRGVGVAAGLRQSGAIDQPPVVRRGWSGRQRSGCLKAQTRK